MNRQTILLVEDSDEDVEALERIMRKLPERRPMRRVSNAPEALDYLLGHKDPALAPRPALILLDLNLPGMDGRALLQRIKSEQIIRDIPVIVMSTSDNPRDVDFCYQNGAAAYQVKAMELDQLREGIRTMLLYWFEVALLPGRKEVPL